MKKLAVLGCTGSVGNQTLSVVRDNPNLFSIHSLVAFSDVEKLRVQSVEFCPQFLGIIQIREGFNYDKVNLGLDCLVDAVDGADIIVVATRGIVALPAVLRALKLGKTVALANKETLVCGGELVDEYKKKYGGKVFTVDSEHSAIWQCLEGSHDNTIQNLILTASGGAFRNKTMEELRVARASDALKHPTWNMGSKITIDSATMMNKGLEIIEASWLFDVPQEKIKVLVHPQSIVHSLVEFSDNSVVAQMACPDMKLPIQYALTYPKRVECKIPKLNLINAKLEFFDVDQNKFKCMKLCRQAFQHGGLYPVVLNGANDVCVENYLLGKISFLDIQAIVEEVLNKFKFDNFTHTVEAIFSTDKQSKIFTENLIASQELHG